MIRSPWKTWALILAAALAFVATASIVMRERCVPHKDNHSAFGSAAFEHAHFHGCARIKSWYEY